MVLAEAGIVKGVEAGFDRALIVHLQRRWGEWIGFVSISKGLGARMGVGSSLEGAEDGLRPGTLRLYLSTGISEGSTLNPALR